MKNLFTIAFAVLAIPASAQELHVSTSPQPLNILIEEYTGIHCSYCPGGHHIAEAYLIAQPQRINVIAMHCGSLAVPATGEPDFRCDEAEANYNTIVSSQGMPTGTINRHAFDDGHAINMSPSYWFDRVRSEALRTAPANLWMDASIDADTRLLTIDIEGYFTAEVPAETYLTIALTQNNTRGPQTGANVGEFYVHQHMLRCYLTPLEGEKIENCAKDASFTRHFEYEIPEDYRGVTADLANLQIVAFIAESSTEVMQSISAYPALEALQPAQAILQPYKMPIGNRYGFNYFEAYLINASNTPITEAEFEVSIGNKKLTHTRNGEIPAHEREYIKIDSDLTEILKTDGSANSLTIKLTSLNGEPYTTNDKITARFYQPDEVAQNAVFSFVTGSEPADNTFILLDAEGVELAGFGPYDEDSTIEESITLDFDTVYCLEVRDAWGDGCPDGAMAIKSPDGKVLLEASAIEDHGTRIFFRTAKESGIADLLGNDSSNADAYYDMLGRRLSAVPERGIYLHRSGTKTRITLKP